MRRKKHCENETCRRAIDIEARYVCVCSAGDERVRRVEFARTITMHMIITCTPATLPMPCLELKPQEAILNRSILDSGNNYY